MKVTMKHMWSSWKSSLEIIRDLCDEEEWDVMNGFIARTVLDLRSGADVAEACAGCPDCVQEIRNMAEALRRQHEASPASIKEFLDYQEETTCNR